GRLQSQDSGKHLHDVLDLLQKHNLVEADISAQAERIKVVQGAAKRFTSYDQGKLSNVVFIIFCTDGAVFACQ
ncbi:Spectrin beta chain, non-erythrocytic 2, partial [Xenoophorus captivus]